MYIVRTQPADGVCTVQRPDIPWFPLSSAAISSFVVTCTPVLSAVRPHVSDAIIGCEHFDFETCLRSPTRAPWARRHWSPEDVRTAVLPFSEQKRIGAFMILVERMNIVAVYQCSYFVVGLLRDGFSPVFLLLFLFIDKETKRTADVSHVYQSSLEETNPVNICVYS